MILTDDPTAKTAIERRKLSAPAEWLHGAHLLKGRVLDYGCGRGDIHRFLDLPGCDYDPNFQPERPNGLFDTVYCGYVLNVIPKPSDRDAVLLDIYGMLAPGGKAYIAVRRDINRDSKTQFVVKPNLHSLFHCRGRYQIYRMDER